MIRTSVFILLIVIASAHAQKKHQDRTKVSQRTLDCSLYCK